MALQRIRRAFTPEEYLALERPAKERSEYYYGEIFAMAGASVRHSIIASNLSGVTWPQLTESPCQALGCNMRIAVNPSGHFTYADLVVVRGGIKLLDEPAQDNLTNPAVIFEVLSPSTESYDRGEKFEAYKAIPSLTDYVLVAQNAPRIEHHRRDAAGVWIHQIHEGLDAQLKLDSIGCVLPLSAIYSRVFP